jgi:hypothetical protein
MRYIITLFAAALMLGALGAPVNAQVNFSISINIDRQPVWGPTGYDHVEYYYLPDIDAYYYVPQQRFFYFEAGQWISSSSLPSRYSGYNLYNSYKVVVNEPTPYLNDQTYKEKYASYKGRHDQQSIRDSHDPKYFVNPKHPEHTNWVKQNNQRNRDSQNNGNDKGNGKNRGKGSGKK